MTGTSAKFYGSPEPPQPQMRNSRIRHCDLFEWKVQLKQQRSLHVAYFPSESKKVCTLNDETLQNSGNYDTSTVYNLELCNLGWTDKSQLSNLSGFDLTGNKLSSLVGTEGLSELESWFWTVHVSL
jgi:hypothetical protein